MNNDEQLDRNPNERDDSKRPDDELVRAADRPENEFRERLDTFGENDQKSTDKDDKNDSFIDRAKEKLREVEEDIRGDGKNK